MISVRSCKQRTVESSEGLNVKQLDKTFRVVARKRLGEKFSQTFKTKHDNVSGVNVGLNK